VSVFCLDASLGLALLYVMQTHPDIAKSLVALTQRVKESSDRLMSAARAGILTVSLSNMCALVHKQKHRRTHTNIETTAHNSTYIILFFKKSVIIMLRVCFVNICACIRVRELGRDYSEHFRRHRPVQKRKQGPFLRRKRCCEEPP